MILRHIAIVVVSFGLSVPLARAEFELKSEDRVVFFGDTLVSEHRFSLYVESFVRVKYPELKTRFFNTALRNQTVSDALRRVETDLKPLSPTLVVVALGLYDPEFQDFEEEKLVQFRKDYGELIERIQKLGASVVLITPPRSAGDGAKLASGNNYNDVIAKYAQAILEIASARSLRAIGWFKGSTALHALMQRHEVSPVSRRRNTLPHPLAHASVAADLLLLWQAEPIVVDIELDWTADQATVSTGTVTVRRRTSTQLSVKLESLPLPWALPRIRPADLRIPGWSGSDLCRFNLKIKNVPPSGIQRTSGRRRSALESGALLRGTNIMSWQPIQTRNPALRELLVYIAKKHQYFNKYWRETLPRRPEEPELQPAFESLCKSLKLFEEGLAKVILRLPKTFDTVLDFEVIQPTPEPPTGARQSGKEQPK